MTNRIIIYFVVLYQLTTTNTTGNTKTRTTKTRLANVSSLIERFKMQIFASNFYSERKTTSNVMNSSCIHMSQYLRSENFGNAFIRLVVSHCCKLVLQRLLTKVFSFLYFRTLCGFIDFILYS